MKIGRIGVHEVKRKTGISKARSPIPQAPLGYLLSATFNLPQLTGLGRVVIQHLKTTQTPNCQLLKLFSNLFLFNEKKALTHFVKNTSLLIGFINLFLNSI